MTNVIGNYEIVKFGEFQIFKDGYINHHEVGAVVDGFSQLKSAELKRCCAAVMKFIGDLLEPKPKQSSNNKM